MGSDGVAERAKLYPTAQQNGIQNSPKTRAGNPHASGFSKIAVVKRQKKTLPLYSFVMMLEPR